MSEAHSDREHARLAPSAAHRWIPCPGSVVLEAAFPDSSSAAAMEGTAAHELAAHCLSMGFEAERFLGRQVNINGTGPATIFLAPGSPGGEGIYEATREMVDGVQGYISLVRQCANTKPLGELLVEQRVHATSIHESDVHGTADAIVYRPGDRELHVWDLKFGRGVPVEAEENKQLLIYASGSLRRFHNRKVDTVTMHIWQPRCPHPAGPHRHWSVTRAELADWEDEIAAAALRVEDAERHRDREEWAQHYLAAGEHCRFCKASATCPARRQQAMDAAETEFDDVTALRDPYAITPDELGQVLAKARQIQHWIKSVEEYANAEALAGRMPTGFKLVAGRRSRVWADEGMMREYLPVLTSVDASDLYEPPKLLSPAKLEKVLSADEKTALEPFLQWQNGRTQLVPEDDPRPAVKPDAATEFASEGE